MSRVSVTYDNHIAHVRLTRADKTVSYTHLTLPTILLV